MQKTNIALALFLLIFNGINGFANNNPHVINFSREEYKADTKNWCIGQDERSFMYFGNNTGLLEFDGVEWRLHCLPEKKTIRSLAVQSHNTLFTGSYEEFGRWDRNVNGKLVYTSLSDQIDQSLFRNDDFWKIFISGDVVYFQSFTSIYIYDYKTVRRLNSDLTFLFLQKVRNEFLVQRMLGDLFRLKDNQLTKIAGSEIFENLDVRIILPFEDHKYLIGTVQSGIFLYDGEKFSEWNRSLNNVLISKELNCGIRARDGVYYFGTISDGIYAVDSSGTIINRFSFENSLQNNTVLSLLEDNGGNIWAALDKGIACLQFLKNISCYTYHDGNAGMVYCAAIWKEKLFVGTNAGVFYVEKKYFQSSDMTKHLKLVDGTQGQVWSLQVVDGKLLCCHNKGLKIISGNLSVINVNSINTGVFNLKEVNVNGKNRLFLSTYVALQTIDWQTNKLNSFSQISEPIQNMEMDHLGNIWLEHANKGIYRCQFNADFSEMRKFDHYGGNDSADLPFKMKLFKVGGRIELLGNNHFYTYNDVEDKIVANKILNDCFSGKKINQIIHMGENQYWALSTNCLMKFFYDGYSAQIMETQSINNGLSLVNKYENISKLNDSLQLICLDNGFLLYNQKQSSEIDTVKRQPPFFDAVETFNAEGKIRYESVADPVKIHNRFNNLIFYFSASNTFTENLMFQYQLDGVEHEWLNVGKVNKVPYVRLPRGKYTFRVRTVNHAGSFSNEAVYRFEILPPWYLTFWTFAAYAILLAGIFFAVRKYLLIRFLKEAIKKERKRETEELKVLKEQLLQEVEMQKAELLTQSSFVIQKNELILKIKDIIGEVKNRNSALIPIYQKINNLLNDNMHSEQDWNYFLIKFEEKHKGFFKNLKKKYPQLTNSDLRLCACLKMNLETKEIASLMNLTVRAVENNRYRLRKKMNLLPSQNLYDFLFNED